MAGTDLDLHGAQDPELVFGLVGPLGSPMTRVVGLLTDKLAEVNYTVKEIHLSEFLTAYNLSAPSPSAHDPQAVRMNKLMSRGNELREALDRGDALAMHAASRIADLRAAKGCRCIERHAFVLRQLKHPDEVRLLRQIYGDSFHLVAIHTSERARSAYLRNFLGMTEDEAAHLLERDAGEEFHYGQQVTKTFHLADVFVRAQGWDDPSIEVIREQIGRYIGLLFGIKIITPTMDEYGMFLAHSAALRSSDLSRQVGAAILTDTGEVISLGANEVPRSGGGQYWSGAPDERDFVRGYDSNEKLKLECAGEVFRHMKGEEWNKLTPEEQSTQLKCFFEAIANTRIMNLTEFGRSVHAEMEAILSAARMGTAVRNHSLFTTTFPCHNCAKHIVGAGLKRLVYVEPYSRSLADRLHGDAIAFSLDEEQEGRVLFEPFHGIAPRRYSELFSTIEKDGSRLRRKLPGGDVRTEPTGLRIAASPLTHLDREAMVAQYIEQTMTQLTRIAKEEEK